MQTDHLQQAIAAHRSITLAGTPASALAYVLARNVASTQSWLLIVATNERATSLCVELRSFGMEDVVLFPGEKHTPFADVSPDAILQGERLAIRSRLLSGQRPRVVVVSVVELLKKFSPEEEFLKATVMWVVGQSVDREELNGHLLLCGYQRVPLVVDPGTFAVRGGIVDIFPCGHELPIRFDLFGDTLTSIVSFDPITQKTQAVLEALVTHPIRDILFNQKNIDAAQSYLQAYGEQVDIPTRKLRALSDEIANSNYFFGIEQLWPIFYTTPTTVLSFVIDTLLRDKPYLVIDHVDDVGAEIHRFWQDSEHDRERAQAKHQVTVPLAAHLERPEEVLNRLLTLPHLRLVPLAETQGPDVYSVPIEELTVLRREIEARRLCMGHGEILDPLVQAFQGYKDRGYHILFCQSSRGAAERLRELLLGRRLDLPIIPMFPTALWHTPGKVPRFAIVIAPLSAGFVDHEARVVCIAENDIFAAKKLSGATDNRKRNKRLQPSAEGLRALRDLSPDDWVIHVDHGIGRYVGLKRLLLNGVDGDYVHLEYQGGDSLYLPVYRLNLLLPYRGAKGGVSLDKLGGTRWNKAKARVKDAVLALAHELLALQAKRQIIQGVACASPSPTFHEFEATFPYEETADQAQAIAAVLTDLCKDSPMDRLICGDVGFGKTEVAMRAAFLTILSGKQVAVLVPTTVLAEQHGVTFGERIGPFGCSVVVMSRFKTAQEIQDILDRTQKGALDVVIGTHRLLSADVTFKNLGLMVVDEEQRFGVKHKERLKQLSANIHVLTLSATPIPRTLHMAMTGLRDLSIIATAPMERTAIQTEVCRFDEEVIAEAIRREIHRGGQVFVVHNRIRSIASMATLVQQLVPEAKVAVAHGQMPGEKLEEIMVRFVRREFHVLVSTAIIESGLDIPSANTMIVNRADTFGLAQLHQLRGRIGRGRERAYAYLLLPRSDRLTKEASERLATLKRFSDLGAGFTIATQDLDVRGAGDLLGKNQSGHIAAVGYELYAELLREAVERAKGSKTHTVVEPDIKVGVSAVLPEQYVAEPIRRLDYYQRMANAKSDAEIFDVYEELENMYGKPPLEVENLVEVMVLRRRLVALGVSSCNVKISDQEIRIGLTFVVDAAVDRNDLVARCQKNPTVYRMVPSDRLAIVLPNTSQRHPRETLRALREEIGSIKLTQ